MLPSRLPSHDSIDSHLFSNVKAVSLDFLFVARLIYCILPAYSCLPCASHIMIVSMLDALETPMQLDVITS